MYIRPSWVFSGLVLSSDRRRSQDRWSGLWGGGVWCISESRRQSKVSGCSDLQGTVEPGRNLYSILASAVPDQTKDQELAGEGEKRKGSVCLREQPAAEHERKRRCEYLVVLFGCSRPQWNRGTMREKETSSRWGIDY